MLYYFLYFGQCFAKIILRFDEFDNLETSNSHRTTHELRDEIRTLVTLGKVSTYPQRLSPERQGWCSAFDERKYRRALRVNPVPTLRHSPLNTKSLPSRALPRAAEFCNYEATTKRNCPYLNVRFRATMSD